MTNKPQTVLPMSSRIIAGVTAFVTTVICASMAGMSAFQRTPDLASAMMLAGLALVMVVGSHLLPALARGSWLARGLFVVCVGVTLYNHAYFFDQSKRDLSHQRQVDVPPSADVARYEAELARITARDLPKVSADLAQANAAVVRTGATLERCKAQANARCTTAQAQHDLALAKVQPLEDERAQAQRAEDLRQSLAQAVAEHSALVKAAATKTVDSQIAKMVGLDAETVAMVTSVVQSLALEIMGMVLWSLALPKPKAAKQPERKTATVRVKHITPYRPARKPRPSRLIAWAKDALVAGPGQPRDSPAVA